MTAEPLFDPEEFALIYRAYATALRRVDASDATAGVARHEDIGLTIALRILGAAATGERDPARLSALALRNFR